MELHTDWDKVWNKPAVFSFVAILCGIGVFYFRLPSIFGYILFALGLLTGTFSFLVKARKGARLRWLSILFAVFVVVSLARNKIRSLKVTESAPGQSQIAFKADFTGRQNQRA